MVSPETPSVRLDRWLWAARLFKTRSLAAQAVAGGKVHVDGRPAKPARRIAGGERLVVTKGPERPELDVEGLAEKRGPASVARTLYTETPESIERRERHREQRRLAARAAPARRPERRDRRRLAEIKRGGR